MITSNHYGRIAFLGGMVILLLAVLSATSAVAYANAPEPATSLTKAYPLNTGPLHKTGAATSTTGARTSTTPAATNKPRAATGTTPTATSKPRAATSTTRSATSQTRAESSKTLPPEANTNSFWPVLVLGVGVVLILVVFWLEIDGWQALRLGNRPGRALNLALGSRWRPGRRLTSRNRPRAADRLALLFRQGPRDASVTVAQGRGAQKTTDKIDEERATVPAPTPPSIGRTRIIDLGQPAPYSPRFGTQDRRAGSRVGDEDRAPDDRLDREVEDLEADQTLAHESEERNEGQESTTISGRPK